MMARKLQHLSVALDTNFRFRWVGLYGPAHFFSIHPVTSFSSLSSPPAPFNNSAAIFLVRSNKREVGEEGEWKGKKEKTRDQKGETGMNITSKRRENYEKDTY